MRRWLCVGAGSVLAVAISSAHAQSRPAAPEVKAPGGATTQPAPAPARTPADTVDAFHHALRKGDRRQVLELLAGDVLVFEQGRLERSRAEYARGHLQEDMGFAAVTQRTVTRRSTKLQGNVAWVLSVNRVRGQFNSKPIDMITDETMVLQRIGGKWRIVHIHWSFNNLGAS